MVNPDYEGTSDFEEELLPEGSFEDDYDADIQLATGSFEIYEPENRIKTKNQKLSKREALRKPATEQSPLAKLSDVEDDDDVDTLGFDASFNLPKERTIESDGLNSEHNN